MRRMLVTTLILAGVALLFGAAQIPRASDQTPMVLWINDSFAANGGKGIFQLTTGGALKLLIPNQRLGAKQGGISDMAVDSQGQIFLLDYDGQRILKAGPIGDVSLAAWLPFANPIAMAIDSQGNFIVADNYQNAIYRVSPDGLTKVVTSIPPLQLCPRVLASISIAIDRNGDYLVTIDCPTGQLLKMTPAGEVTVIFDYNPQTHGLYKVVVDPTGQGYFASGVYNVYHISPAVEVKTIAKDLPNNEQGKLVGLTVGPSGDLFVVSNFGATIYEISPDGSQVKVLFHGAPLAFPEGILWIAQ